MTFSPNRFLKPVLIIFICEKLCSTDAVPTGIVIQILDRLFKLGNIVLNILVVLYYIFTLQGDANALHWSALGGNVDLLKFVLPKFTEADKLHDVDVYGHSLVYYASRNEQDNPEMVSYIVEELKFSPEEKSKVRHCWLQVCWPANLLILPISIPFLSIHSLVGVPL